MEDFLKSMTKNKFIMISRIVAMGTTALAAIVMATSRQQASVIFVNFGASYNNIPAFKYFVIMNAVASVYSLTVLFVSAESLLRQLVMGVDAVITVLLTSSISAALAIAFLGKDGNFYAGWLPICGQVQNFCRQAEAALIAGFIGVIVYLVILLFSIHQPFPTPTPAPTPAKETKK